LSHTFSVFDSPQILTGGRAESLFGHLPSSSGGGNNCGYRLNGPIDLPRD
jgi:hypothetical protein